MRRILFVLALMPIALPARAADFYILNISDDYRVLLLDPTTIVATPDGHRIYHLAEISEFDLWVDDRVESDCAGGRIRKLSALSHLAGGGTVPGLASPADWDAGGAGSAVASVNDVVCQWPDSKPTGNSVYAAPDFETAVTRISGSVTDIKQKK